MNEYLPNLGGLERLRASPARCSTLAAGLELIGVAQHPVEARFRGDIAALVGQCRDDLAWRQMGELGLIDRLENRFALGIAEAVGRRAIPGGSRARILANAVFVPPALQGTRRELQYLARLLQPSAGATGLLDEQVRGDSLLQDVYLRQLLIHGARAVLGWVERKADPTSRWATALKARRHRNVACVAMANKITRVGHAVMTTGKPYDPAIGALAKG